MLSHVTRTLLLLVVALWHHPGTAAVITSSGTTAHPNNDNFRGRGNPNVERLGTLWLGAAGRAQTQFDIEDSGGTTEYAVTVSVTNQSGVDWAGYNFSLAVGGERGAAPVPSATGDGFGFDVSSVGDPLPESDGRLRLHRRLEDVLDFSGPFPDNSSMRFSFSFDIPDRLAVHRVWLLEQPALVPEPGTFALLAGGLGVVVLWRRARPRACNRAH